MQKSGRIVFSQMDEVLFGEPLAKALVSDGRSVTMDAAEAEGNALAHIRA